MSIHINCSTTNLDITTKQQSVSLHPIWLRERSRATDAADPISYQRLYDPEQLDSKLTFKTARLLDDSHMIVDFSDKHQATYAITELLSEVNQNTQLPAANYWHADQFKIEMLPFDDKKNTDKQLLDILSYYHRYGFVIVSGLTAKKGEIVNFAERIGAVRQTNFGKTFDVISVKKPIDLAYTTRALGAHTDNPYRKPVPGVQLLFCIQNETDGGHSTLTDGFQVAKDLQKQNKNAYDILSTTDVLFRYRNHDTLLENWGRLIELDQAQHLKNIRFSNRVDFVPHQNHDTLNRYYEAKRVFHQMINDPHYMIDFQLPEGGLLMMNNERILHGRTSYDSAQGNRFFQGLYIDHDSTESQYKILKQKLATSQ